jgi:pimeloyl-ACP methyl ester carboxylesterase
VLRRVLHALVFSPDPAGAEDAGPPAGEAEDMWVHTSDGERLNCWWVHRADPPALGHVLLCHGNGGSVRDTLPYARLLAGAGYDVVLFDYRGYGRSTGRPSEEGTYTDARAIRAALLARDDVKPNRLFYLGESLGGAVALRLAVEHPPAGLILQSTFTNIRDMAALHYPFIPRAVVPDAYPSLRLVRHLHAPLLVLHGARDDLVPVSHGQALFDAAPNPKRLHIFPHAGHNDLLDHDSRGWIAAIATWAREAGLS